MGKASPLLVNLCLAGYFALELAVIAYVIQLTITTLKTRGYRRH